MRVEQREASRTAAAARGAVEGGAPLVARGVDLSGVGQQASAQSAWPIEREHQRRPPAASRPRAAPVGTQRTESSWPSCAAKWSGGCGGAIWTPSSSAAGRRASAPGSGRPRRASSCASLARIAASTRCSSRRWPSNRWSGATRGAAARRAARRRSSCRWPRPRAHVVLRETPPRTPVGSRGRAPWQRRAFANDGCSFRQASASRAASAYSFNCSSRQQRW